MDAPMLELEHVTGKRGRFRLQDVSFSLPTGYMMGLAGENGAGKTTLLEYIVSPKKRYTGTIRLMGRDIREDHAWALGQIGFLSEQNEFFRECSVRWNMETLGGFYERFDREKFLAYCERMELSAGKTVGSLSRGELMRFQLAFAMAHGARLYLIDEATSGMDPVFRMEFFRFLHEAVGEDAAVLMATHLRDELERRLDYTALLEKGRLVSVRENL